MSEQKRVLIFVHDGRGLGHLRRLSRLAARLQGAASVLFITGHNAAAYIVPSGCEYVHLPSMDSIDHRRSRQWGRLPFLAKDVQRGRAIRQSLLAACVESFAPHAFISDYLPLGMEQELAPLLSAMPRTRKYFIVRGLLGDPATVRQTVLTPQGVEALEQQYDLLLATCDERIVDLAGEYSLPAQLVEKLVYTGYAAEPYNPEACAAVRRDRHLPDGARWIVCTAGGGKDGEDLMQECWQLALKFPECHFDIVLGPRSRIILEGEGYYGGRRIYVRQADHTSMPELLGAADVVICRGGYNTLMEALVGPAHVIVAPIRTDYEQVHHARRLTAYRPLTVVDDIGELDLTLETVLQKEPLQAGVLHLNLDGLANTARLIISDLEHAPVLVREQERSLAV